MEINESDFQSETGKRLYYLLFQGGREKEMALRDDIVNGAAPRRAPSAQQRTPQQISVRKKDTQASSPAKPKKKSRKKQATLEQEVSTQAQPTPNPAPEKRKWELPPEYQQLSLADAVGYCIRTRSIPEQDHAALLKIFANVVTGRSTLVTGASGSGKSYTLNTVLMTVPGDMKDEFADSKQFFNVARKKNGKFKILHLDELQTFLRGSVNEKDAIRKIGYGEHYDPKQEDGVDCPIEAHGVYTCVADSNAYKKRLMSNDKELMRRLDKVDIQLDDDKIKQRNATVVNDQNPAFSANERAGLGLKVIQYHMGQAINRDIPEGTFFNPFAQFFAEYIQDVCKEKGSLEESTEVIKGNKSGMLLGVQWSGDQRKFEKGGQFKYISSIEDAFVAKLITDKDLGRDSDNFDWHACWESGIESLRAAGYPVEIIASYQAKHVSNDNKLYVTNPFTNQRVLLADLNKPKPGYLIVTTEPNNTFTEESTKETIDDAVDVTSAPEQESSEQYAPLVPVPAADSDVIDADFTVLNETKALPGEKVNLPVTVNGTYRLAPRGNGRDSSPGLPSKERKYLTCKED